MASVSRFLTQKPPPEQVWPQISLLRSRHCAFRLVDLQPIIQMKSEAGVASRSQKQASIELLAAGATWWMARSAGAAMTALYLLKIPFRRRWRPQQLEAWEGPFGDPTQRLPQHPRVKAERREAQRRWRERRWCAREIAQSKAPRPEHSTPATPDPARPVASDAA
jgi:hypothetical protein